MAWSRWWRECPGCGFARRLADGDGVIMCVHNRWDPASYQMVRCDGSGQPPAAETAVRVLAGSAP